MPDTTPVYGFRYLKPSDPPDLAGGLYDLADSIEKKAGALRCALQLNSARGTGSNNGDIPWDTVLSDPAGMRDSDGLSIKALWNGRYAVGCRVALQGNIPPTDVVSINVCSSDDGNVYGSAGMWGLPGDQCASFFDEITLAAGARIRFRIGWSGTTGARQFSYGNDAVRARIFARYLGPA